MIGILFAVLFGPLVWAAHLLVLYGTHALACAAVGRTTGTPTLLVAVFVPVTALALVLAALPLLLPQRFAGLLYPHEAEENRFLLSLMRWLAGLSLTAVVANGIAMLMVPTCS